MAALQDSRSKDPAAKRAERGGGGEPKQRPARSIGVDTGGASRPHAEDAAAAASVAVMVEDPDALDCGVCCLPLKPPIFQCDVGHVVCSLCRDKLQTTGKCHVCGVATSSYRRCHAMERLVESIRVPCSYAAHGCALRPAYYDQESHRMVCVCTRRATALVRLAALWAPRLRSWTISAQHTNGRASPQSSPMMMMKLPSTTSMMASISSLLIAPQETRRKVTLPAPSAFSC